MMQFHLSRAVAKPLARHLTQYPTSVQRQEGSSPYLADLFWKVDIAMIGAQACIVAQEQNSLYLMVFCGLTEQDFDQFPELFRERFWRELASICKQAEVYDTRILARELATLCDTQHYWMDPNPIEEGKIPNLIEKLERRFLHDKEPLPSSGRDAFEFTFPINSRKPKSAAPNDPSPAEQLGNLCLNLIDEARTRRSNQHTDNPVISEQDNIVTVDFNKHSKKT